MKRLLSPLFILLLFLLPLAAQEPWKACLGKPIGRLSFTGISLSQEKIVREFLQSRTGEPLSILSVDRDIKSILQLQLFDNVTADAVPEGQRRGGAGQLLIPTARPTRASFETASSR